MTRAVLRSGIESGMAHLLVLVARVPIRRLRRLCGAAACWLLWRSRVRLRFVYDDDRGNTFDPRSACNVYASSRCGGCDDCLIAQARHYGAPMYPVPAEVTG